MFNHISEDDFSKREIKCLYNHSMEESDHFAKWSEFSDPVKEEQSLKALAESFAVVHRFSRLKSSEDQYIWKTHSIEIQSPRLKVILAEVFNDYPDWTPDDTPYTFFPPFKPFLHRWDKILGAVSEHKDPLVRVEFARLYEILVPLLATNFTALEQARATKATTFHSLWLIYAPGDLMIAREKGNLRVSKLRRIKFVKTRPECADYWELSLDQVDWNGSFCGFENTSREIVEFSEAQSATKLAVYPFEFAFDQNKIRELLIARGRKFESLRGFHVKNCTGKKYIASVDAYGRPKEIVKRVSGRVIVDAYAYYKCQDEPAPSFSADQAEDDDDAEKEEKEEGEGEGEGEVEEESAVEFGEMNTEQSKEQLNDHYPAKKERKEELRPLTDLECLLAVPRVKGFDIKSKQWCEFNVDDIQEPNWNDAAYENLVLPEGEKELAIAFANRSRQSTNGFDDFVQHKGEGIIILLCGPPGVGKTLTAEAVADKSKIPLYMLSAGDLGTQSHQVEAALDNALECCRLWNAVLLLDEADIYLEKRNSNSLDRNELVSIFLRRLEYYQGLMFLTTNRIDAIDAAFKSRIDLILPYHDLDELARRSVWVNFVRRMASGASEILDGDYDELAKNVLNGREIKNLIKTAQVLAAREGPLKMKHLQIVLNIRKRCADFG